MSVARVISIYETEFSDFTYNTYNFAWPILEYGVAIVVCCGPLLRPVIQKYTPSMFESRRKTTSEGTVGSNPERSRFNRLRDVDCPIQPLHIPTTSTSVTGEPSRYDFEESQKGKSRSGDEEQALEHLKTHRPGPKVVVERSFDVESSLPL